MTTPLDRPIWHALCGRQAGFAMGGGLARRFRGDVSPFVAARDDSPEAPAAVAGEGLKLPGMSEVSGVCTHPDARGRGLAGLLSRHVASEIVRRGEVPFLHAYSANTGAIRLYEGLGFRIVAEVEGRVVRRD